MDIEQWRKKSQIVIWANPRGVFVTVHANDEDDEPTIDSKRFESWTEMLNWIDSQYGENNVTRHARHTTDSKVCHAHRGKRD